MTQAGCQHSACPASYYPFVGSERRKLFCLFLYPLHGHPACAEPSDPHGHESEQTPGDGEGQGSLACCSPWGRKESDTT